MPRSVTDGGNLVSVGVLRVTGMEPGSGGLSCKAISVKKKSFLTEV